MNRIITFLVSAALAVGLLPAGASAQALPPDTPITITGSGWGHGVGMSQYGARAMAETGMTAEQIVGSYYAGITVQTLGGFPLLPEHQWMLTDPDPLWVGLAQNRTSLRFHVDGPAGSSAGLCKAGDGEGECPTQFAQPGEAWEFKALGGGTCQFFREGAPVGKPGYCRALVEWSPQPDVSIHLDDLGREYARGTIRIRPVGNNFHVSLEIGVEDYVKGIAEVPSSWPTEALRAQAIAARTYGVRQMLYWGPEESFGVTRQQQCWCQLYSSVVDQNFVGYGKETEAMGDRWVAAVDSTAGRVVTHPEAGMSTIIVAYYSSSSGGHTDSNVAGLGHSQLIPYLPGVDDPWSVDPRAQNPFASWSKTVTASTIADLYSLDDLVSVQVTRRNDSGSVAEVQIVGTVGGVERTLTRSGRSFKATLGLRSHYFSLGGDAPAAGPTGYCETDVPPAGFSDVGSANPHGDDIDCMAYHGIMPGTADNLFRPVAPVLRWEMALYMIRHAELVGVALPDGSDQGFTDIADLPLDVQTAVNQLRQLGLTKGVGGDRYDPNGGVPRWQMAIFLTRLHRVYGYELPPGLPQGFTDLEGYSEEAKMAIRQLFELGVTTGTSETTYTPGQVVTQEQMASFLSRLLRLDS